jgi:enterochelin esterase family protein
MSRASKVEDRRGSVVFETLDSRLLRDNPLGDPSARMVTVYLPPGYDAAAKRARRYPVIHVLSGFLGSGQSFLNWSYSGESLDRRLDRLIGSGAMKPCIVVLPDAMTAYGGSQYVDSRGTGRYGSYFTREVVPFVDRVFRTLPEARHRAVMGKSSGGFGALYHAMQRPDLFGAVASHSGDMYFEYGYLPDLPKACTEIGKAGGLAAWQKAFRAAKKKSHAQITTLNIVAMAACYSPTSKGAPELPFDLATGELRHRVWDRWLAKDPVRMLETHHRALAKMRLVFLDAGRRDEWNLHLGARIFAARARRLGVKVTHEEFDDGHMDVSYRFDVSLPKVARAIAR